MNRLRGQSAVASARRRWFAGTLVFGLAFLITGVPAAASSSVPYTDPNAVGYIGLCNEQGQQITSGNIDTAPFAWRAVSTAAATGAYAGPSRTAILFAYQPIDGLAPSYWSVDSLTASARYSNPAAPMAAATTRDESLAQYMLEFKPKWDGYLQLRMYLGADNEQPYSVSYPTLDIQVTGDSWRAVDGGPVAANATEDIMNPAVATTSALRHVHRARRARTRTPLPVVAAGGAGLQAAPLAWRVRRL